MEYNNNRLTPSPMITASTTTGPSSLYPRLPPSEPSQGPGSPYNETPRASRSLASSTATYEEDKAAKDRTSDRQDKRSPHNRGNEETPEEDIPRTFYRDTIASILENRLCLFHKLYPESTDASPCSCLPSHSISRTEPNQPPPLSGNSNPPRKC